MLLQRFFSKSLHPAVDGRVYFQAGFPKIVTVSLAPVHQEIAQHAAEVSSQSLVLILYAEIKTEWEGSNRIVLFPCFDLITVPIYFIQNFISLPQSIFGIPDRVIIRRGFEASRRAGLIPEG